MAKLIWRNSVKKILNTPIRMWVFFQEIYVFLKINRATKIYLFLYLRATCAYLTKVRSVQSICEVFTTEFQINKQQKNEIEVFNMLLLDFIHQRWFVCNVFAHCALRSNLFCQMVKFIWFVLISTNILKNCCRFLVFCFINCYNTTSIMSSTVNILDTIYRACITI